MSFLTPLTMKLIGAGVGLLAVLSFIGLSLHWKHEMTARGEKLEAACQATRDASGLPKLKCGEVPEQIRFLGEALNAVRTKTAEAKASDQVNKVRVEGEQSTISTERKTSYETRIADARARADSVRPTARTADSGSGGTAPVPSLPASAGGIAESAGQDGLPASDALTATEQAIQLDELIKWVKQQHAVDVNGNAATPE